MAVTARKSGPSMEVKMVVGGMIVYLTPIQGSVINNVTINGKQAPLVEGGLFRYMSPSSPAL
ncbi:Uncharacterized protein FKW44_017836 [Caligus rogercresseyi]|uniref:Uncharacterized protein n=1 Tax=Caligus rogercresseyi TaxID=217165 RepID=A0A7T8GTI8_CALRO|nr:Uncharacterized protein FKW44_017836 [Caligus rogercresseyi]